MNQLIKFSNNASVRVSKAVKIGDKKIYVNAGDTAFFPTIESNGEFFILCLVNSNTGAFEIMKCIATESNAFIVERALEGTTERAFPEGSLIENRLTAGSIQNIFNFTKASKDETGLVYVGDYDDLVSDSLNREPVVPDVNAVKQYVEDFGFIAGGIIAFSGTFIDGYPVPYGKTKADKNWHICDGTHGTPNLNDRFIRGTSNKSAIGSTGGSTSYSFSCQGGSHALTIDEMPKHSHRIYAAGCGGSGPGFHYCRDDYGWVSNKIESVGGGKPHTHSFSITGSSNIVPPYYTLAYIMKIK